MGKITKAIIPAAGLGTRMKPITNYLPKPMLPLGKKPVIQHIVEELKGAGITEIVLIIRKEHESIVEYFSDTDGLSFIYDETASGPGGAILKAEPFVAEENFVVIFSDAPIKGEGRSEYLKNLVGLKEEEENAVLSIYEIPGSEISSRGIVTFEEKDLSGSRVVKLKDIIEKPSSKRGSQTWASACRYVLGPEIFDSLKKVESDEDGELQLTPAIRLMIAEGYEVLGYPLAKSLNRYDTGNFEGYFQAFIDFASDY